MGRIILDTNQFMLNTRDDMGDHHRVTTKAVLRHCLFFVPIDTSSQCRAEPMQTSYHV